MDRSRSVSILLVVIIAVVVTACGRGTRPPTAETLPPSLALIRSHAARALDDDLTSSQRLQARDQTMTTLLQFLRQSESIRVGQSDWEAPLHPDERPFLRLFESGPVRVYAVTLLASGIVPPGERVAVQYIPPTGAPQAYELTVLPGGMLSTARALEVKGVEPSLTLAFGLMRGGGYVAHYQQESRTGEFRLAPTAFKGIPSRVGDLMLDVRENVLLVGSSDQSGWRPYFDPNYPLRLHLNLDIALDWKSGFILFDESNLTAFQGFSIAFNAMAVKQEREEAWEKAIRKLPAYLEEQGAWEDELTSLPQGSRVLRDQLINVAVRMVSIPPPQITGATQLNVVQYRVGNGLPSAQELDVPGLMESFRLINREGLPGLLVVSARPTTGQGQQKFISLYRFSGGNTWEPAPDWFGFMPGDLTPRLERIAASSHLQVNFDTVSPAILLRDGELPDLELCLSAGNCVGLLWVGGRLVGTGWFVEKLKAATEGPQEKVLEAAESVRQFLLAPEAADLSVEEVAVALGRREGVAIQVYDAGQGSRVVALPPNRWKAPPVLVQAGGQVAVDVVQPGMINQWSDIRVIEAGGQRWLMLFGGTSDRAAVLLYQWEGNTWKQVNALNEAVDRTLGATIRVTYQPGQTMPARGLIAFGGSDLVATVLPGDEGVLLCEQFRLCVTYWFDRAQNRWALK